MADRPIRTRLDTTRNLWCCTPKEFGDIVEYEKKNYKVLICKHYTEMPLANGKHFKYYLTVSEVK